MTTAGENQCPCGSGKTPRNCCLQFDGTLRPAAFVPKVAPLNSGVVNAKCYAAGLGNCSREISGEHYVSHGFLRQFSVSGIIPSIAGLTFLGDETKSLPTDSLRSNILCKRHNEVLSGFDDVGSRFFSAIDRIDAAYIQNFRDANNESYLFNGHDIERWMLKTLCGLGASGVASSATAPIRGWKPNPAWLSMLFLNQALPCGWGLYCHNLHGSKASIIKRFQYNVLSHPGDGVYGLMMTLNGKKFLLAMAHSRSAEGNFLAEYRYRPDALAITNGRSQKVVKFGWDIPACGGIIRLDYIDEQTATP